MSDLQIEKAKDLTRQYFYRLNIFSGSNFSLITVYSSQSFP